MLRKLLLALTCFVIAQTANAQLNITFRSNYPYSGVNLANIGGYVDSTGNEYALVGTHDGLSIVDVTDPVNPFEVFLVPGTGSNWREVKTWQNYAYVTTEGCCNGLQIINLGYLPDSVQVKDWQGTGAIAGQLHTIHALHVDAGYAYLFGSNLFNGAAVIADLADPWNPVYTGHTPGSYIHDGYVRNDTLWAGHIYDGYFSVIDVSNKANPVIITTQSTPGQFTHNTWLNDQGNILYTTDEVNNSYLTAYDISDIQNIQELQRIQLTPGSGSIVHNTHTLNDFEIVSWYKDGVAIVDVSRPGNMIVTGHYDTYAQGSGPGFSGCWGVYPYLPSGNLVVSDINNGLFVLTPDYVRGCYLEGLVTDSVTGIALPGVTVNIINQNISRQSNLTGEYKTGLATAGVYDVEFSKAGYYTKTVTGVTLQNGNLTPLDVELVSMPTVAISGQVTVTSNGNPVDNAVVHISNSQFDYTIPSDVSGNFSLSIYPGTYDIQVGKWGFVTTCLSNQTVTTGSSINLTLAEGYYDDFSLDFGWTISGTSPNAWERDIPVGTFNNGVPANPGTDALGDCLEYAYVTDNGGGTVSDHDIDNGSCILTSPVFDATLYSNPFVNYYRWFFNAGTSLGPPDDTMKVILDNGISTAVIEEVTPSTLNNSQWVLSTRRIADYLTPTANMRLIVNIADPGPIFSFLEGGFDLFTVTNTVGVASVSNPESQLSASPNPFSNSVKLNWKDVKGASRIVVQDISGRVVLDREISGTEGMIEAGNNWPAGYYIAGIVAGESVSYIRIVKQ